MKFGFTIIKKRKQIVTINAINKACICMNFFLAVLPMQNLTLSNWALDHIRSAQKHLDHFLLAYLVCCKTLCSPGLVQSSAKGLRTIVYSYFLYLGSAFEPLS